MKFGRIYKNKLLIFSLVGSGLLVFSLIAHPSNTTKAAIDLKIQESTRPASQTECGRDDGSRLLGIIPRWDRGLGDCEELFTLEGDFEANIKDKSQVITTNIINILASIAGLVAVGFIIFAGFKFVLADGDPGRLKNARQTIINALAGLGVAVSASLIIETIIYPRLTKTPQGSLPTGFEIDSFLSFIFLMIGFLAVLMVMLQGIRYITSGGKPEETGRALRGLISAAIGVLVATSAWALVEIVLGRLVQGGDDPAGLFGVIFGIIAFVAGIIAVITIIVAGLSLVYSGDSPKVSNARQNIIYALIGLVITVTASSCWRLFWAGFREKPKQITKYML